MIDFFVFWFLILVILLNPITRKQLFNKPIADWILDTMNLAIQGIGIPLLSTLVLANFYAYYVPQYQGTISLHPVIAILINLFVIDYLYYWNHRLFHTKRLFPIHFVHHTVENMDVMATARNTVWTNLLFVYLWGNSLMIYLLQDPYYYTWGIIASACLDMWKHSSFLRSNSSLLSFLSKYLFIMTPAEHSWHHAENIKNNFGANFNIFDKLHGTHLAKFSLPAKLGLRTNLNLWRKAFYPFRN